MKLSWTIFVSFFVFAWSGMGQEGRTPKDAVGLYKTNDAKPWESWAKTDGKGDMLDLVTRQWFGNYELHVDFMALEGAGNRGIPNALYLNDQYKVPLESTPSQKKKTWQSLDITYVHHQG